MYVVSPSKGFLQVVSLIHIKTTHCLCGALLNHNMQHHVSLRQDYGPHSIEVQDWEGVKEKVKTDKHEESNPNIDSSKWLAGQGGMSQKHTLS